MNDQQQEIQRVAEKWILKCPYHTEQFRANILLRMKEAITDFATPLQEKIEQLEKELRDTKTKVNLHVGALASRGDRLSTLEAQNKVLTDNLKSKILSCLPPGISMQDHSDFSQKVDWILKIHHSARTTER